MHCRLGHIYAYKRSAYNNKALTLIQCLINRMPNMMLAILCVPQHCLFPVALDELMKEDLPSEQLHLIVLMVETIWLGVGLGQAMGVAFQLAEELDWVVALGEVSASVIPPMSTVRT